MRKSISLLVLGLWPALALAIGDQIVWRFDQPGTVNFACLVMGHMEAGMMGTITVQPGEKSAL